MNHTGKLNRILLVMCILMCVFVSSVIAGEVQNPADNSARIPVLNDTITTTTAPSLQNLPVHSTPPNKAPVNPAYLRYLQQQQAAKLSSLTSKTADPEKPARHTQPELSLSMKICRISGEHLLSMTQDCPLLLAPINTLRFLHTMTSGHWDGSLR